MQNMNSLNLTTVFFCILIGKIINYTLGSHPPGHLQPLGSHRSPEKNIDESTVLLHPEIFFNAYYKPGIPLLFKGIAKRTPGFHLWSDNYFSSKYGHIQIDVEINKKEDRDGPMKRSTLGEFLTYYNDSDYYLVSDVPEEMIEEVMVPKSFLCGGFEKMLQGSVLWFSSGGTKSVLHYDELDNINCLYDGSKNLVLISKNDTENIIFDKADRGYSSVDVEKVDMYKYFFLQNISWYNVTMETGDCLFIPYKWAHHVISSNTRNLAVNLWFVHLFHFNSTDCQVRSNLPEWLSLASYPVNDDIYILGERGHLITSAEPNWPLSFHQMSAVFKNYFFSIEEAEKAFEYLDTDEDHYLSIDELLNCDLWKLAELFGFAQNDDSSEDNSTVTNSEYDKHSEL